jgi:uncharacterized protein YdaT
MSKEIERTENEIANNTLREGYKALSQDRIAEDKANQWIEGCVDGNLLLDS